MADTATRSPGLRERRSSSPASAADDAQNSIVAAAATTSTPPTSAAAAAADSSSSSSSSSRLARFQALQARAKTSARANLKEAAAESRRLATDTTALAALGRKHAAATHNLAKADAEAAGEDFERKRAWDWTAEEAERWDRRAAKKARNRDAVAFADYSQEAAKTYKRQMREMRRDVAAAAGGAKNGKGGGVDGDTVGASELEAYAEQKAAAVRRAAESGGLALVEDPETGELVAIDRHGTFGQAEASDFDGRSRPSKEGVDRLVQNLKKAEEQRLKNRKDRNNRDEEDGPDVTYINEKNKQFNMKLARFYNKYTADIRESFERGTMI